MCGIAGYICHSDSAVPPSRATLIAMRDHMSARGPDGAGLWLEKNERVGFAHRRLSIIDLSAGGTQPMTSADGALSIVFNGEIYNYRALRSGLIERGHIFVSESDTEVILHLYREYGAEAFAMLRGMFALCIWDEREQKAVLARDPYGIKPLYYSDTGGCVRFASQVKALICDPAISREISPAGLVGFHLFGSVPDPHSIYAAVRAVPAGAVVTIDRKRVGEPIPYASIAKVLASAQPAPTDPRVFRAAIRDSVAHHLVADVEVGAFLSGGVDSGALLGLMRDCGQDRITACTLRFGEFAGHANDETDRAEQVAKQFGVTHHIRDVTAAEFRADLPSIIHAMDQPSIDGVNTWFVSKATRELGFKVAISGLGGDELLAGYPSFRSIPRLHRGLGALARTPLVPKTADALLTRFMPGLVARNPKARGLLRHSGSWAGTYMLRRAVLLPFELEKVMTADLIQTGLRQLDPVGIIANCLTPDPGFDTGRISAMESGMYMRNQLLRDSDWAGMAHSLEIRVPLVDFELLKAVAPMMRTMRAGEGKELLAGAPSQRLPVSVVDQPKTGFGIPVGDWLKGNALHKPDRLVARGWAQNVLADYFGEPTRDVRCA